MQNLVESRFAEQYALVVPAEMAKLKFGQWGGLKGKILLSPEMGSGTTLYFVEVEPKAEIIIDYLCVDRFVYVSSGHCNIKVGGQERSLRAHDCFYTLLGGSLTLAADTSCLLYVFERYTPLAVSYEQYPIFGTVQVPKQASLRQSEPVAQNAIFEGISDKVPDIRCLTFRPGAIINSNSVRETITLMLHGNGVLQLNNDWYLSKAGHVSWTAPQCSYFFGALGKEPISYLRYEIPSRDWTSYSLL